MTTSARSQAEPPGESPSADLSGRTLADFHLLRLLGKGGMGQVYLAEQISLKRKVALKLLRSDTAADAKVKVLARFRREAEAVAQVTHANIVQVYAYGEADGMPYMALEYVEGRNLREYINKKGPPDLPVALTIMRQIAAALQRASEFGLVHRDIKPENILLTRKGEVKVADFGLSYWLEGERRPDVNLTASGVTMGTPLYMSPEQVEGKPIDARTDIYSFGVTGYHMLAGQPPFRGSTAFEVAIQHVRNEPEPLTRIRPDLPAPLCDIVHKMMAKLPDDRYQTCRDILRDLARVREGLTSLAPAGPPSSGEIPSAGTPGKGGPVPPNLDRDVARTESAPVFLAPPHRPARKGLIAAVLASLVLAAATGMVVAWKERSKPGPYPGTENVRPADASHVETVPVPSKREQALRLLVDGVLTVLPGKVPDKNGFNVCMELGLFYLEEKRLDDADKHFDRLVARKDPVSFYQLGVVGKAIVLALRNRAVDSNGLFNMVFAPPGKPYLKGGKTLPPFQAITLRQLERGPFAALAPLLTSPRGRDWLGQARWYNFKNGVPEEAVPRYLSSAFPLAAAKK